MPSGAYQVTNGQIKMAERDQSFRNCIATMFIFIILCLVIILVTLPWRKAHQATKNGSDYSETEELGAEPYPDKTTETYKTTLVHNAPGKKNRAYVLEEDQGTILKTTPIYNASEQTSRASILEEDQGTTLKTTTIYNASEKKNNAYVSEGDKKTTLSSTTLLTTLDLDTTEMEKFKPTEKSSTYSTNTIQINDRFNIVDEFATSIVTSESDSTAVYTEVSTADISALKTTESAAMTAFSSSPLAPSAHDEMPSSMIFMESSKDYSMSSATTESDSTSAAVSVTEISPLAEDISAATTFPEAQSTEAKSDPTTDFYFVESGTSSETRYFETTETEMQATSNRPDGTSLLGLVVKTYFGNDSEVEEHTRDWLLDLTEETPSTHVMKTLDNVTTVSVTEVSFASVTPEAQADQLSQTTESYVYNEQLASQSTLKMLSQVELNETDEENPEMNVCVSGRCKQMSSRIVSYMNHSADPCEDFYEYACGGMEADPQRNNWDLDLQGLERIKRMMEKERSMYAQYFRTLVDSCVDYYKYSTHGERITSVKKRLESIGTFYTELNWPANYSGITHLISNMMLNNRPLLFDIALDIDEINPQKFILRLGPPTQKSPLRFIKQDSCIIKEDVADYVDLQQIYDDYNSCKNSTKKLMDSISEALRNLGIFEHLDNVFAMSQYFNGTVIDIDLEIIKGSLSNYPHESEIREAYKSKTYSIMTLGALEAESKLLNWTQLLFTLTGRMLKSDTELQIYFKDHLLRALHRLSRFNEDHELQLNNALLGLYAHNMYEELVKPEKFNNLEQQCLLISTHILPEVASRLYISSFSHEELNAMQSTMAKVFKELKQTLKIKLERTQWTTDTGRQQLLLKLESLKLAVPDDSYFKDLFLPPIYPSYEASVASIMKTIPENMYKLFERDPSDPRQLWKYFATPFQSVGQALYSLDLILMPIGAMIEYIGDGSVTQHNDNFSYLTIARVGIAIAQQIAHHFDVNGIHYWNGTRDSIFAPLHDEVMAMSYDAYIDCHSHWLFQEPIGLKLPATNQQIHLTVPSTTLNERLADAMGITLAHDTLVRGEFTSLKRLPWLDLDVHQLFYLAYAQTHCTKTPLATSYISLYEEATLPSRLRIFAAAINDKMLGEVWHCPEGSQVLPSFSCAVFPYLDASSDMVPSA